MEYRKLISFGKSSYVISLPKSWIRQNQLKKGDLIYVDERENSLVLDSKETSVIEEKSKAISVDGKSIEWITRELNSAYIENYREIVLTGKELKEKSEAILPKIRELIALEVMELDGNKIVTKDFLNMNKVSIPELIRKMDMIIRSMLKDCANIFAEDTVDNIYLRDKDVNRLSFLIYRAIRYGIRNPSLMLKNFDVKPIDLLNDYWVGFHLEAVGDSAKRIARELRKSNLPVNKQKEFSLLFNQVTEFYLGALKAYYQKDHKTSLELSNSKDVLIAKIRQFYEQNKTKKIKPAIYLFYQFIESIHELCRLSYQV
ncbi:MAG TPA: phosphate uptake regulator PhoU [Candidatus Nanoarchaeia archaeon]|nr:phosphate uptake regulator PhoU [Candidatus Nanoarchaeia archaeon]